MRTYETPSQHSISTTEPEGEDAIDTATTPISSSSRSRFSPLTAGSRTAAGISRPTKLRVFRREAFDTAMLEEMTKAAHEFDFADELLLLHESSNSSSSSQQQQLADEIARGAAMLTALEQLAASPAAASQAAAARPRFRREAFDSTMLAEMGKAAEEFEDFSDQLPAAQQGKAAAAAESFKKSGSKAGQSQTKPPNHAGQFASHLKQVEELMASMMSMGGHSTGAQQHPAMPMPVHPHLVAASGLRQSSSPYLGGQPSSGATSQPSFSGGQYSSSGGQSSSSGGQYSSSSSGGQYSSSGGHQPSSGGQYSPRVVPPNAGQSAGQSSSSPRGEYLYSSGIQYPDGKKPSGGGPQVASGAAYSSGGPQVASGTVYSSGGPQGPSGTVYSSGGDSDAAGTAAAGLQATIRKLQRREVGSDFATTQQSLEELQQAVEEVDLVDAVLEAGGGSADPGLDSTSSADPYVFGPPGSGSGSFYYQANIVRKTLIPTGTVL